MRLPCRRTEPRHELFATPSANLPELLGNNLQVERIIERPGRAESVGAVTSAQFSPYSSVKSTTCAGRNSDRSVGLPGRLSQPLADTMRKAEVRRRADVLKKGVLTC